jgi:NADPH-dependent curcumin reductase CurA
MKAEPQPGPTDVPNFGHPARNRRVLLARRPTAIPAASDFALDEAAIPEPAEAQLLVRNIFL